MKKYMIIGILLMLLLCGCAKEEEIDPDAVNFAECPTIDIEDVDALPCLNAPATGTDDAPRICTAAEDGMFFLKLNDGSHDKQFLHFYDFTTGETYPVCAKPNCTHGDYLCSAYLTDASFLHYDGSYLYYFSGNGCQFWRMNTDGTDRKVLFTCNEKAESGALMSILGAAYLDGKVYFAYRGSAMNPETLEITSGESICVGDLSSGKFTILPVKFQEDKNSSTLNVLGMYDHQLVIRHSNTLSTGFNGYQKNEETICLLDVNTLETTVLYQWQWDTNDDGMGVGYQPDSIDEGYMILCIYSGKYQHPTYADGEIEAVWPGDRLFVDLSQKKAYRMTNQDSLNSAEEIIADGKWIHLRWDENHTFVEKVVQDLATGEVFLLPESIRDIPFDSSIRSVGKYYVVGKVGAERWMSGYLPKEDYWAGKQDFVEFPEWVILT